MKLTVDNFFFYLLCFFPVFLVAGPFLADLALTLLCFYFLIKVFLEKNWKLLNNTFFLFFFFILFIFISQLSF